MELRHLRYFVAVAEELHFRRAAERLHVAQPAVSEQIRKLEDELGVRLLNRTQRSVSLTEPGSALLTEGRRVLRQAEVAQLAARNARDTVTTRLRLGYLPDSLPASVPRALQQLAASAPGVQTSLETGSARALIEDLRAERLDAAVVSLPAPAPGLTATPLGDQRAVLALPVLHPRASDAAIALERLVPERIVLMPRETNPAFHDGIVSLCRNVGVSPDVVHVAEPRVELALLAAASGVGPALLPDSVAERFSMPGIRFVPLEGGEPVCQAAILTRPHSDDLATVALRRAVAQAARRTAPVGSVQVAA